MQIRKIGYTSYLVSLRAKFCLRGEADTVSLSLRVFAKILYVQPLWRLFLLNPG